MKILILASNPRKDLNLDREIRDLRGVIERSRNRQQFEVEDALAVRVEDLQELLFRHKPEVVHFCGHGSGQQGLVFEGNDGGERGVRAEALSELFRLFSKSVGCVLLNACYSEEQANAIVNHIDYVIGMNQAIQDDAAIAFSKGFYRALGYECSIEQAYEFGRNAIQLEISGSSRMRSAIADMTRKAEVVGAIEQIAIPEHLKPILKIKPILAPSPRANIAAPDELLSQETRDAIQLDIDKSLDVDTNPSEAVQQYDETQLITGRNEIVSTLLNELFDALYSHKIEVGIQKFEAIAHKSLFSNGKIDPGFIKKNFNPSFSAANRYERPVRIISSRPGRVKIGSRADKEDGEEIIYLIARNDNLGGLPGEVRIFFPANSATAKISGLSF